MTEIVIVANRLPFQSVCSEFHYFIKSPGGLVSALHPVLASHGGTWIGWSGNCKSKLMPPIDGYTLCPVEIDESNFREYYNGFSNRILWPLYHHLPYDLQFYDQWWNGYETVNQIFAIETAKTAKRNSCVWIHDYHLQLVPEILRRYRPDVRIGFFLHTPFPDFINLHKMPRWRELVIGMSSSHLVGFQTERDLNNFQFALSKLQLLGRRLQFATPETIVDPVSVDFETWNNRSRQPEVLKLATNIRDFIGRDKVLIIGIDRLDRTKGILNRLLAFRALLNEKLIEPQKIAMVVVASTGRESNDLLDCHHLSIENLIVEINNKFSNDGKPLIYFIHRHITPTEVSAFFKATDILIVSSLQDGMNLIAKEFVANATDNQGILILSQNAGAAFELDAALKMNPYSIDDIKNSIITAIKMNQCEATSRMQSLRVTVQSHDIYHWANQFLDLLTSTTIKQISDCYIDGSL